MPETTPLDTSFTRMQAGGDPERLQYYAALADTQLYLLLEREAGGSDIEPRLLEVDGQNAVAAFDSPDRLAAFAQDTASYAVLPGRILAQLLAPQGLVLAINLGAASEVILPTHALGWLTDTLDSPDPESFKARIVAILPLADMPDILLEALGARLVASGGLAHEALLAAVEYEGGQTGHVLALIGAEARAETALARAVAEALAFSGLDTGYLDVVFLPPEAPIIERMRKHGRRFEIPAPQAPDIAPLSPPGSDPAKPPRLR